MTNNDVINHPQHYTAGRYETITGIEYNRLGYHLGNAFKYISRAGLKSKDTKIQDLKKALWYLRRYEKTHLREKEKFNINEYISDLKMDMPLALVLNNIAEKQSKASISAAAELLSEYIKERET